MIYTITLNPAFDQIVATDSFNLNQTNYYHNTIVEVGGKGVNCAIMLHNLNTPVTAISVLGTKNFNQFSEQLSKFKINTKNFKVEGYTRVNYKISVKNSPQVTELNGEGLIIPKATISEILTYLQDHLSSRDFVMASGSVPKGNSSKVYQLIGDVVRSKKAVFILDTAGENLIDGLKAKPLLIKPNWDEVCELYNHKFGTTKTKKSIEQYIAELKASGAQNVIISMGSDGSYVSWDDNIYKVTTPKVKTVNASAAGDSMLAAFVYGIYNNLSIIETCKYASAAGAGTAATTGIATLDQFSKLRNEVNVVKL